ncbi:MAG: hypothetical protein K2M34_00645 [Alphaproteobacteria bacterium]|nr:hypothetical protein [Alphaproteobacteria bacterium]
MKKLTAGIFAGILTIVAVNAANADIATTNYVNQNVDTKVGSLGALTTTAKNNTVAAINEVNAAVVAASTSATNALADAKEYADGLNTAMDARVTANKTAIDKLNANADTEGSIANIVGKAVMNVTGDIDTLSTDVEKLKGNADTQGSVANSIATAIAGLDGTVTGTGVVKTISQTDGKVTATLSAVSKTDLDTGLSAEIDAKMATTAYNTATTMAADGAYAKKANTVGANLTALDTQVKANADAIAELTGNGEGSIDSLQNSITDLENNKANSADVYTKTEIDGKIDDINDSIDGKVTAKNLNNKLLTTTTTGQLQDASTGLTKPAECSNPGVSCMLINDGTAFKWEKVVDTYTASAN